MSFEKRKRSIKDKLICFFDNLLVFVKFSIFLYMYNKIMFNTSNINEIFNNLSTNTKNYVFDELLRFYYKINQFLYK